MAGHSHWAGIKHKKAITDAKRAKSFTKLLKAIAIAAKDEPNSEFNPRLRTAILKAREAQVPADTIQRAIDKAAANKETLEALLFEAYGPGGIGMLIEAITDNRNRTIAEVKSTLNKNNGKIATPGSVVWAFTKNSEGFWIPSFPQDPDEHAELLMQLIDALEHLDDVQEVITATP